MGRNGKGNNRASGGSGRCGGKGAAQVGEEVGDAGGTTSAQQGGLSSLGPVGPGEHLDFTLERWGPR